MWNLGTHRPDAKGAIQAGKTRKNLSTNAGHGGGPLRSSDEASVMGVEQRERIVRFYFIVNRTGRNC